MTSDTVTIKSNIATDIYINNYVDELHERLQSDSSTKKKSYEHSKRGDKIFLLNFKTRKMKEIVTVDRTNKISMKLHNKYDTIHKENDTYIVSVHVN